MTPALYAIGVLGMVVGFASGWCLRKSQVDILQTKIISLKYHLKHKNAALQRMMQQIVDARKEREVITDNIGNTATIGVGEIDKAVGIIRHLRVELESKKRFIRMSIKEDENKAEIITHLQGVIKELRGQLSERD